MASVPVFITQYELLRSQDYVLVTFSTPSGEVIDGRMQTQEIQRVALTMPRFLELAAMFASMAANITNPPAPRALGPSRSAPGASPRPDADEAEAEPKSFVVGDWVVRH